MTGAGLKLLLHGCDGGVTVDIHIAMQVEPRIRVHPVTAEIVIDAAVVFVRSLARHHLDLYAALTG